MTSVLLHDEVRVTLLLRDVCMCVYMCVMHVSAHTCICVYIMCLYAYVFVCL